MNKLEKRLVKKMRESLMRFVNSRERAYKEAAKKYNYRMHAGQAKAITSIRKRLAFCSTWGLKGHCRMVINLYGDIQEIMPHPYAHKRQLSIAETIHNIIQFANNELDRPINLPA